MRQLLVIFFSVFMAEIGDKTQLATVLFATDETVTKTTVFLAAAAALVSSTLLAVVAGGVIARIVSPSTLRIIAGIGFLAVGLWTLISTGR
jgi:putative Ca2+/H+ antiporter (TMEM165/GDT1 family)